MQMKKNKYEEIDIEMEMLHSFIREMNLSQLQKLSSYAAKLLSDKRYNKNKLKENESI